MANTFRTIKSIRSSLGTLPSILLVTATVLISSSGQSWGQKLAVRTERAPFFVGESIAIEIDAVDFDKEPSIEIEGDDQKAVSLDFRNTGRSESTQIFQSGGKIVRNRIIKTTFYYTVTFAAPGNYKIGPFKTEFNGKSITHPAISYEVRDIETTPDMRVEVILPGENFYPNQRVPVRIRWMYSGDTRLVRGLNIRSDFFEQFRFVDEPFDQRSSSLPITTSKGIQNLKAEFKREKIDGKEMVVGTATRTMIPDQPTSVELPAVFVSFKKVIGSSRSRDIFDGFFDVQTETKPYRGVGTPIKFDVRPFPTKNRPPSFLGAVGQSFQLTTSINRTSVRTGDPLTLQLNIKGNGILDSIRMPKLDSSFSKDDFEWPDGEVAGIAKNNQKQFLVSLRVKKETVTELPPIEFSWFDPKTEKFQTAYSEPIPLDVSKGEVITSNDVFSNAAKSSSSEFDSTGTSTGTLDLSIETEVENLIAPSNRGSILPWIFYAAGALAIGMVLVQDRRQRSKDRQQPTHDMIQRICRDIQALSQTQATAKELSQNLRELQIQLKESYDKANPPDEMTKRIDQLIGRCDAISFRPTPPTRDEQSLLIADAHKLIEEF